MPSASPRAVAATGCSAEEEQRLQQEGWRLCISWWPGRGQTLEHPAVQRLMAAGTAGPADAAGTAASLHATAAASVPAASDAGLAAAGAGDEGSPEPAAGGSGSLASEPVSQQVAGSSPAPLQTSVLLFCRGGSAPYVFCGRLRPAAASSPPGDRAGRGSGSCILWELADRHVLLASSTFRQLLGLQ